MIILHRKSGDIFAKKIEEKLQDLVVAHKIREYADDEPETRDIAHDLPCLQENGTLVVGRDKIEKYLNQLTLELRQQRTVSGDGCYIDPETGKIC